MLSSPPSLQAWWKRLLVYLSCAVGLVEAGPCAVKSLHRSTFLKRGEPRAGGEAIGWLLLLEKLQEKRRKKKHRWKWQRKNTDRIGGRKNRQKRQKKQQWQMRRIQRFETSHRYISKYPVGVGLFKCFGWSIATNKREWFRLLQGTKGNDSVFLLFVIALAAFFIRNHLSQWIWYAEMDRDPSCVISVTGGGKFYNGRVYTKSKKGKSHGFVSNILSQTLQKSGVTMPSLSFIK